MYNNNKSAYFMSLITALFSCGLIYYGITFLDLIPTLENFNELYRDSNQTYPELKKELESISTVLTIFGVLILLSASSMLSKFKYSIHALLVSLFGLCVFTFISFDAQSFILTLVVTSLVAITFLAYHKSFGIYRDNFFVSDFVSQKLKLVVNILLILITLLASLFYLLLNSSGSNSSASLETMIYEVKFSDGSEYKGKMINNVPHGHGEMFWPSGKKYIGNFVEGKIQGQGNLIGPAGEVYYGELLDGAPDGVGKIELPNGYIYEGQFTRGAPNGKGQCYTPIKGKYDCNYVMGKET